MKKSKSTLFRSISISLFTILLSVILSSVAFAGTARTVCVSGCGYSTIQAAINASSDGDIVVVRPGTYTENIDFGGLDIEVTSQSCPEETIIDGDASGSVVIFEDSETSAAILNGFTITNGSAAYGGGVHIDGASPTIKNCIITSNVATSYGGGIYVTGYASPSIEYCVITYNDGSYKGGGVHCESYATPTISDCDISYNSANDSNGDGGGIYASSEITVTDSTITHNGSYRNGYGICISSGELDISDSAISYNTSTVGYFGAGTAIYSVSSTITVDNCTMNDNKVAVGGQYPYSGPVVYVESSTTTIRNNTIIEDNEATEGSGGVIAYAGSAGHSLTITDSIIRDNIGTGSGTGGGVGASANDLTISDSIISGNTAGTGGGIYFNGDGNDLSVTDSFVTGNTALGGGGGISMYRADGASNTITNCLIADNTAVAAGAVNGGGGLKTRNSDVTLTNVTMADNTSTNGDGDEINLYLDSNVDIENSIIWRSSNSDMIADYYNASYPNTLDIDYSNTAYDTSDLTNTTVTDTNQIGTAGTGEDPDYNKDQGTPDAGKDDYYIVTGSPCIDEADATNAPADDIVEVSRPQGSADDMGAYENDD